MSSLPNLPKQVTDIAPFTNISQDINELFNNPNIFQNLLEYVLKYEYPKFPVRKNQIVLDYMTCEIKIEPEKKLEDEVGRHINKFADDYIVYHMNSIVTEEKELRMTTWELSVLDNFFGALKDERYGFIPLTVHSRDTPNANRHYLLIILDYTEAKYYLFDSRNSNDYIYRSKYLPKDVLEQLMIGLSQYQPFKAPFEYVPMGEWLGPQLQTVVHNNRWDSLYSLAWCISVALWLNSDDNCTPETIMVELNNSDIELDKNNFIHEFIKNLLTEYAAHLSDIAKSVDLDDQNDQDDQNDHHVQAGRCSMM